MGVSGVSAKRDTTSVQSSPTFTLEQGNVVINFNGKKEELSKKQAEVYFTTFYNLNFVRNRIDSLDAKLRESGLSPEKTKQYKVELEQMQQLLRRQQEVASFELSATEGVVRFTIKQDINAEDFKELFFIMDGALRKDLTKEALDSGIGKSKGLFSSEADIANPYRSYKSASAIGVREFPNGVYLEYNEDKEYWEPNYTKATLSAGKTYTVEGVKIDPEKDVSLLLKLLGLGLHE